MRGISFVLGFTLVACSSHDALEMPNEGKIACEAASDCPSHWYCLGPSDAKRCYSSKYALDDAGAGGGGKHDAADSGSGGAGSHTGPDAASDATGGKGGDTVTAPNNVDCSHDIAPRALPSVMLVIDGSSSMMKSYGEAPELAGEDAGATSGPTRWQALRDALVDPKAGVVPKLQGVIKFGLAVFGTTPTCPLPLGMLDPALHGAEAISAGLPMEPPGLYTPTGDALDQVVDRLPDPSASASEAGPQIVVLATDGDPNSCGDMVDPDLGLPIQPATDYAPSLAAALKLQKKHLQMYVFGVGNEATKKHLQQMANLGAGLAQDASPGATVHYPKDPEALADALAALIGREASCDVELSGEGVGAGQECTGRVTLAGKELACNDDDGWVRKDATHITLQGAACKQLRKSGHATLHAQFPCYVPSKM